MTINNCFDGIDIVYYYDNNKFRYDYVLSENSNIDLIQFKITGADKTIINEEGDLVFNTKFGEVKNSKLFAYQQIEGQKHKVECAFKQLKNNIFSFKANNFDKSKKLIIDPILYGTFFGGSQQEGRHKVAIKSNGNPVVFGESTSINLNTSNSNGVNSYQQSNAGLTDAFVAEFNTGVNGIPSLVFATYFGGSDYDYPYNIAVDDNDNIILCGGTRSSNFPLSTSVLPYQSNFTPNSTPTTTEGFISKLSADGGTLMYSTYIGNTNDDKILDVDIEGSKIVALGVSNSNNLTTINQIQNFSQLHDYILLRINPNVSGVAGMEYLTYIGGNGDETNSCGLKVLSTNGFYAIAGSTTSTNYPLVNNYPVQNTGGYDGVVTVVNSNLTGNSQLIYSSKLSGSQDDLLEDIDSENNNLLYVCGQTQSTDFGIAVPGTNSILPGNPFDNSFNGGADGIVAILDPFISGNNSLQYATYYGGDNFEDIKSIKYGQSCLGATYLNIAGFTFTNNASAVNLFPLQNPDYSNYSTSYDAFFSKLEIPIVSPTILQYSTYIPGSSDDQATDLGIAPNGDIIIVGSSNSSTFLPVSSSPLSYQTNQSSFAYDMFLLEFLGSINIDPVIIAFGGSHCVGDELYVNTNPLGTGYTYQWDVPPGQAGLGLTTAGPIISNVAGIYTVTVTDPAGCTSSATFEVSNGPQNLTITSSSPNSSFCQTNLPTLTANYSNAFTPVTYSWNYTTPTIGNPVLANPNVQGAYQVIATDAYGCTSYASLQLTTLNSEFCCSPNAENIVNDPDVIILDNKTATDLIAITSNSNVLNALLFINGTFTVNQDLTIDNSRVYFTANSKIVVNGGNSVNATNTLEIKNNSILLSPDDCPMWDGIYANAPGAQIISTGNPNITVGHNVIRDMINGVNVSIQASINCTHTFFDDNRISMQLKNLTGIQSAVVTNSRFKTQSSLLKSPYNNVSRGENGIIIDDCPQLVIGGTSAQRNKFENLYNGIYVNQTMNFPSTSGIATSYNEFLDINGGVSIFASTLPGTLPDYKGKAIYASCNNAMNQNSITHIGNNNNSIIDFLNCQRAIQTSNFETYIKHNYTNQTEATFMCHSNGQVVSILSNHINDTYLGANITGGAWGGASDNVISNLKSYVSTPLGVNYGKGIDWSQFVNLSGGYKIERNDISTNMDDYVLGINMNNIKLGFVVDNTINFYSTSTIASPGSASNATLVGIALNKSKQVDIGGNTVTGTNTSIQQDARRSLGMYMQKSDKNYLHCNIFDYLQQGIAVHGESFNYNFYTGVQSSSNGVEQNRTTTTRFGWLFRHLSTMGNFGDIGVQGVYDANNKFYNVNLSPNYKVRRVFNNSNLCNLTTQLPTIYTDASNLIQTASTSDLTGDACAYKVENNNPGVPYFCNPQVNITPENTGDEIDIDYANHIAENEVVYSEYPDLGENFDERMLYAHLFHSFDDRNNYPVLNQFYLNMQNSTIDKLVRTDEFIAKLAEPETLGNPALFATLLSDAKMLNNDVSSMELFDINERTMNTIYLKSVEFGLSSLNSAEWSTIATLAQECPYVAGNGVYKARALFGMLNPFAYFNDMTICNNVGVYKNSTGLYNDEDAALDALFTQHNLPDLLANQIQVYPNPSSDQVTLRYTMDEPGLAEFIIIDIMGNTIQKINLTSSANYTTFSIKELASGMYQYRYVVNGKTLHTGKLIRQ